MQKYGFDEARPMLERASARETAARVALGEIAAQFMEQTTGATLVSHVVELGTVRAPAGVVPMRSDLEALDADPVRCFDADTSAAMVAEIDQAHKDGDTLGGVVEVVVEGLPPGLGSHTHWDRGSIPASPARSWASRPSRASRWATASSSPAPAAPSPTTRSCRPTKASGGSPAAPAAPRAA